MSHPPTPSSLKAEEESQMQEEESQMQEEESQMQGRNFCFFSASAVPVLTIDPLHHQFPDGRAEFGRNYPQDVAIGPSESFFAR